MCDFFSLPGCQLHSLGKAGMLDYLFNILILYKGQSITLLWGEEHEGFCNKQKKTQPHQ